MIHINNRGTGVYLIDNQVHFSTAYNKGLSLVVVKQDDDFQVRFIFNRKLGWWPYLVEDLNVFEKFLTKKIKYFIENSNAWYFTNMLERQGGSVTVDNLHIHNSGLHQEFYLNYSINLQGTFFKSSGEIKSHDVIHASKALNKALTEIISDYKYLNQITTQNVRKTAAWRRYVRDMRDAWLESQARKDWNAQLYEDSDLPF